MTYAPHVHNVAQEIAATGAAAYPRSRKAAANTSVLSSISPVLLDDAVCTSKCVQELISNKYRTCFFFCTQLVAMSPYSERPFLPSPSRTCQEGAGYDLSTSGLALPLRHVGVHTPSHRRTLRQPSYPPGVPAAPAALEKPHFKK